ncbi:MAG: tetratricopeptide repeat protein [Candidatus Gastranaerophilales bacterium]|nr:tetratricopeptide repeat protein [Candidatus Gastranaerophilales bacterium]
MNNNENNNNDKNLIVNIGEPFEIEDLIAGCVDNHEKARLLLKLGLLESFKKSYDKAIKHIEEAQQYFLEYKDTNGIANCLAEMALIHYQNCNDRLIRSLTLLNDAKCLMENVNNKFEIEAKIIHYYGVIYFYENRYSESLRFFKNALKLVNSDCLEYAKIQDSLAIFYLRINNYHVALKYLKSSLNIKKSLNNDFELSITEILIGRYLSSIQNHEEAHEHFQNALITVKKLGDSTIISRILDEIAKINLAIGNYDLAEQNCINAIEFADRINNSFAKTFSQCTLANIYICKDKSDEALVILNNEIKTVFSDLDSARGSAICKRIESLAYFKKKEFTNALENMHEAIAYFENLKIYPDLAKCYHELALIYRETNDIPMAVSSLLEALRIAKAYDHSVFTKQIEDLLFEIDEQEWENVINKTARKEDLFPESKSFLNTLTLIDEISKTETTTKDTLLSLLRLGRSIAAETDVDKLLEIITEETRKALNADRCTVFLLDKNTNELWSKVALGMGNDAIRIPTNTGLAGHVIMTGETVNIKDAYNDARFNKEIDKKTGYITKTILCMPMRNMNHEISGVFQVLNKHGNGIFTDEDEDLLIAIGSSAGIALENARLFKSQNLMFQEQKKSFDSFINTLAASIDAKDKITAGHSLRVKEYTVAISEQMGLPKEEIEVYDYAATLHDFGKIGIKDSVLYKEGRLTDEEYKHIQEHVFITDQILSNLYFEEKFKNVPQIAASHHEKFDGSGYYRRMSGENIPLGGRILAVSDVFDATTSKRHYRDRMPFLEVLNLLKKDVDGHFDSRVVNTFFEIGLDRIFKILLSRTDEPFCEEENQLLSQFSLNDFHMILLKNHDDLNEYEHNLVNLFNNYYYCKIEPEIKQ